MLVEGKSLAIEGAKLVELDNTGSLVVGKDELSLTSERDNSVIIYTDGKYIKSIRSITDFDERSLTPNIGIDSLALSDESLAMSFELGNYSFLINGKRFSKKTQSGELTLTIDDKSEKINIIGKMQRSGKQLFEYYCKLPLGKYELAHISDGASLNVEGRSFTSDGVLVRAECEKISLALRQVPLTNVDCVADENFDGIRERLDAFCEAEDFVNLKPKFVVRYSNRPFLSGGVGVKGLDKLGDRLEYTVNIPEDGNYDLCIKYVAWNPGGAERVVEIDGESYLFRLPETDGWGVTPEVWRAATVRLALPLSRGEHTVILEPYSGEWNIDWLGFLKNN